MLCHDAAFKQEARTEAMHISHKQPVQSLRAAQTLVDALLHAARGTVGKRQTGHVFKNYPVLMRPYNALGQHGSLAAPWRRQYQMVAARSLYDLLLFCVKCHHHIAKVTFFYYSDKFLC